MGKKDAGRKLRIGFIHPDLGIGGAERLVVDAAVALQNRGHDVMMFTSRHDPTRCFQETIDGTLVVQVLGGWLPQRLHSKIPLTIVFSILRNLLLTLLLCMSLLFDFGTGPLTPLSGIKPFDVYIVDQQSVCVPFLRFVAGTRVVFYLHFPDKLLSGGWQIGKDEKGNEKVEKTGQSALKQAYRWPIDTLEEWTTGQSDVILANSGFTSRIYAEAFPSLAKRKPRVVYPCIDLKAYPDVKAKGKGKTKVEPGVEPLVSDRPTLISFNRFEGKKNVALAVEAFVKLRTDSLLSEDEVASLRLVLGGGYDPAMPENAEVLASLRRTCDRHGLIHDTLHNDSKNPLLREDAQVIFIPNFTNFQRTYLLTSPNTLALLYTPANEHFGIVPIEAMACGLPVIAADSGGPMETIVDLSEGNATGMLRTPTASSWSQAIAELYRLPPEKRKEIGGNGRKRVQEKFSLSTLGEELEEACLEAFNMPDLRDHFGDRLIWGGAGLVVFSISGIVGIVATTGF